MIEGHLRPLGEVAEFVNGRAFKPSDRSEAGIPIIRIQNLTNSDAVANLFDGFVDTKHAVNNGDLLVSWSATLDVFEWNRGSAALNQHIFKVLPFEDVIFKRYLYYALKSVMAEMRSKTHGATMKHITKGRFEGTRIPVPPLAEQERIVNLLDEADAIRKLRSQADQRTADLLPALFHEMFGDPITNPMGWPIHALGAVLERIDSGWSPPCEDRSAEPDEWGVLKLGSVTSCQFIDIQNKALPCDRIPRPEIEVSSGDLLFSRKNTSELVAACAYVFATRSRLMLSDLLFRLRIHPDAGIDPLFLWALLTNPSKRKELQRLASGSASSMPNISMSRLSTALILIPPLSLQQEFRRRVGNIRAMEGQQSISNERLEQVFQSMLHRALAGTLF